MRYLRYGLLAIGITLMPLLTALVLQVQAAPPSKLALAAQATALATPAAPQAQAGLTSQDRQRLTYVGLAADAMASVVDVLQIEAGALLPLPASAPAGQTGATPGAASTTVAPVGTPGAGTTPSSLGAGAVALTPAATLGATTSAAGATVAPVGTPGAGTTPSSLGAVAVAVTPAATLGATTGTASTTVAPVGTPGAGTTPSSLGAGAVALTPAATLGASTGAASTTVAPVGTPGAGTTPSSLGAGVVALTPAATLGASTGAASTTVAPATSGQTQAPALPTVTIARPLELIDFIGRMRIILRTASDGLDTLDWTSAGNRAVASRIVQVCPAQGSSIEAAEDALRTLQAELRRGQQGAVVIDPIALRGVLEAHARLQASRRCMTGATMSVMGTTTPAAGTTPGALGTPAAVTPSTGATSPAALTPAAPAATVAGSIATPRAGTVSAGGATPGAGVTPGALGTPAATPVAGGVSTEERLNGVDRAIQAIQSQLNALFGARPAPAATPGR